MEGAHWTAVSSKMKRRRRRRRRRSRSSYQAINPSR